MPRRKSKKRLRILLVPGIGDAHWVVLKLESFLAAKNATADVWVWDFDGRPRSVPYLDRIPFVRSRGYWRRARVQDHHRIFERLYTKGEQDLVEGFLGFDYFICVNGSLRMGKRLEDEILPEYAVNWNYKVTEMKRDASYRRRFLDRYGPYILLGFSSYGMFSQWVANFGARNIGRFLVRLQELFPEHRTVLTGSPWDEDFSGLVGLEVKKHGGKRPLSLVGKTRLGSFLSLTRGASAFLGWCGGNTIMSTHFRVPTVMIWSDYFPDRKFWTNWVDPAAVGVTYLPLAVEGWSDDRALRGLERIMPPVTEEEGGMTWWPGRMMGFYPAEPDGTYDESYWSKYVGYAKSTLGRELTRRRVSLTRKYVGTAALLDVGIGCGHFVERRGGKTTGYDVNPTAVNWLLKRGQWQDPHFKEPENASFWDALEHIRHPEDLVKRVRNYVFLSIPIFRDQKHALGSKHFRPDEHFWYFTEEGLERWFHERGFQLAEKNRMEEECGREDIGTFVFRRLRHETR